MPGMTSGLSKCQKKPSQLVFVPSMAISQQYRMPSFWFLVRAALHKIVACAWFAVGDGLGRLAASAGVVGSANWLEA